MLPHLNVLLVVRGPKLNTALQVWPHQCRVQGHDPLPTPVGHTTPVMPGIFYIFTGIT